ARLIAGGGVLEGAGTGAALAALGVRLANAAVPGMAEALPSGVREAAALETLPGKKPLIKLSYRPPNYETPIDHFREPITPNDAFFVRYHLAGIPDAGDKAIDPKTWRVGVGGGGANGRAARRLPDPKALPPAGGVPSNQC